MLSDIYKDCPLTDAYRPKTNEKPKVYAIRLMLCTNCNNLQLANQVNPAESYEGYEYKSAITPKLIESFVDYARDCKNELSDQHEQDLTLLDVGSNDGSFLVAAENVGFSSYGIEPSSKPCNSMSNKWAKRI